VQRFRYSEGIPPTCQTIEHRTERQYLRDLGTDDNIKVNLTVFHSLFNDASLYPDYITSNGRITEKDKQERIWKEAEVAEPMYFLWGKLQKKSQDIQCAGRDSTRSFCQQKVKRVSASLALRT
jgi:hypothetical protein